jgi:hypothetical protein
MGPRVPAAGLRYERRADILQAFAYLAAALINQRYLAK